MRLGQYRTAAGTFANLPEPTSRARRALLCVVTLLPAVLAWGCAGIVSGQNSSTTTPPPPQTTTYIISGMITGGNGATVTLTGAANATTTADGSGNFTFSGLANGTYTITPSHAGYTFNPSSLNVTVSGASITTGLNFTASAPTFSVSGAISPAAGGSGATVALSGAASATTVTDNLGNFSFSGLASGTYVVTPANTGYAFSPVNQTVNISTANVSGINFTAAAQVAHSVALTWNASTSTVSGYNAYRSTVSGGPYTKVNPSLIAVLNYTDSTVLNSTTYFYVTTAVDSSSNESTFSNEVQAIIP